MRKVIGLMFLLAVLVAGCGTLFNPFDGGSDKKGNGGIPSLRSACSFGVLASSQVTNVQGSPSKITGDVGVSPGTQVTGFPSGTITGTVHAGDAVAALAQGDLGVAYVDLAGRTAPAPKTVAGDLGGMTLTPGIYKSTSSLFITGNLTLSGDGVYIFQIASTLTTAAENSQVILAGGAQDKNVYWVVGSSATLGTHTTLNGNVLAQSSITLTTGATLNGRALARTGAVTLDDSVIVAPACP
ncbi:MAG TPA: ice-binding family protein [Candidatus Acidoferrum sp.]|nr:ice-binding family protein [Candidatus Acidoferrum sp.]